MAAARHPWYFETDSPRDALECRRVLERYLSDHCEEADLFPASLVFGELLSNVIKHTPQTGVRVWLEHEGDRFALCMNDNGRGFNGEHRAANADEQAESGRGLYIVRRICRRVSYKSVPGRGFTVRAVLPFRRRIA
jgi:anti-sigma regulatory factor (Ser/Thr protein kinase)